MGMRLREGMNLVGRLTIRELLAATGEELSREEFRNLTTLVGKRMAMELAFGQHTHFVQFLAAGANATAAALTDTALYNELVRGPLTSVSVDDNGTNAIGIARYIMGTTQGNGQTFREAGLFNDNNEMYARVVHADKVKDASKIIVYQWDLTYS